MANSIFEKKTSLDDICSKRKYHVNFSGITACMVKRISNFSVDFIVNQDAENSQNDVVGHHH